MSDEIKDPRRREFLRRSGSILGAASALSLLPPAIRRALAVPARVETGTIQDVKHVVFLMQENRSFDHYFGTLRGVRGFGDRFPIALASGKPVWFQSDGTKEIPPYHLDPSKTRALLVPDTPHTFADSQAAWNQGSFGHWPRYKTEFSMGHYQREDIPFQFALAEAFTLCDAYHCSVTSGTDPNRIVFFSGSNFNPALRGNDIDCTDSDAEPNNLRCSVSGMMPSPGYTYRGSAFHWPTLPVLLQQVGISWRIYQDPNDNYGGLMHGGLAFEGFRNATASSGSPLYENGMQLRTIEQLRKDVTSGALPAISWVLPSAATSEHPGASNPARAADFIAQVLDALTANTASWSQSVFFLAFDENDGFFDHVPPPAPPSYGLDGTLSGASTVALAGEYFSDPARAYLNAADTISGTVRAWGLGARVPLYVISPWSKGGWVNSQVFDHTSAAMFLERRFGISVTSISPWHRAVCGDLTSAFDFATPNDASMPTLPDASHYATVESAQMMLPAPLSPGTAQPLFQETGTRYSRALPYELHTSARVQAGGEVTLIFSNTGKQGVVFHVYDQLHLDRLPRRYTVQADKSLSDVWNSAATDAGQYNLWVYSANGFVRAFQGNTLARATEFSPEIQVRYQPRAGKGTPQLHLNVNNSGAAAGTVTVLANAYRSDGPWPLQIRPHAAGTLSWNLASSGYWYDFSVQAAAFARRFAGRVETGEHGISDPAMARNLAS
ncbi:MAG: phospholipase C, phosphocholine-specific [Steroidobacteraceae bacterium]